MVGHKQSQKKSRSLKFGTNEEEGLYYHLLENKDTEQLYNLLLSSCASLFSQI